MEDCPPEQIDQFDRLPDDLLLLILNRVRDAKTLTRCLSVSRRFGLLVPQTHDVFLPIPRRLSAAAAAGTRPSRVFNFLVKTVRFLRRVILPKSDSDCCDGDTYYEPNGILRRFGEIRSLSIEIPSCGKEIGLRNGEGVLLKWIAEFGEGLHCCAIVGADSVERIRAKQGNDGIEQKSESAEPILSEKELKQRVVWIISCLIAAASRHALLKDVIKENPNLEEVQMTDEGKQGKLWMGKEQIGEVRKGSESESETCEVKLLERSVVPDLKMKLWFVPEMELPESGFVMKGATLVVIRPANGKTGSSVGDGEEDALFDWLGGGGGGGGGRGTAVGEAVREMRKMKVKRTFTMEMNSF